MAWLLAGLRTLFMYGGTAAIGWGVSDYFNETKKAEQMQGITKPTPQGWFAQNWKYMLYILLIVWAIVMAAKFIAKKLF